MNAGRYEAAQTASLAHRGVEPRISIASGRCGSPDPVNGADQVRGSCNHTVCAPYRRQHGQ